MMQNTIRMNYKHTTAIICNLIKILYLYRHISVVVLFVIPQILVGLKFAVCVSFSLSCSCLFSNGIFCCFCLHIRLEKEICIYYLTVDFSTVARKFQIFLRYQECAFVHCCCRRWLLSHTFSIHFVYSVPFGISFYVFSYVYMLKHNYK